MKKLMLAAAFAVISHPALAADRVYLDCLLSGSLKPDVPGKLLPWKITLDEDAKTITYEHAQASGTVPAFFGQTEVTWMNGDMRISRTDLTITRYVSIFNSTTTGQCKVAEAPKRAF